MHREKIRAMKRDCHRFMRAAMVASALHRLISAASPMIAAGMIGDMANHLLTLDSGAIAKGMPAFLCAVFFQVFVAPECELALNLLLTKQGFAYDGFLMEKFIRLPLRVVQTTDAGCVMERLEEDASAFCWNQMTLYAYPAAVLLCAASFGWSMVRNHIVFTLAIVLLAALPVIRAGHIGKRQTELKKQVSEQNEARKQMEQELFDARDFAKSFSLDGFFIGRLRKQFAEFLEKTGREQDRMDAQTETLDFLCSYGVQLGAVLLGAVLISLNQLTLGGLLSGYLMIPALRQCCQYVREWVIEAHDEKKYLERLAFFYETDGEDADSGGILQALDAEDVCFAYPGTEKPVLDGMSFHMTSRENYRLVGANGSGKTTLLSILAGLYEPQGGTVCGGAPVGQRRKSVALQEQEGTIFSGTVWDNLFAAADKQEFAARLLSEMGMEKPLEYVVTAQGTNLSPGEKKKILLSRALLKDAPFLLLDEPLNHLDEQGGQALLARLVQRGTGILLISHQDGKFGNLPIKDYVLRRAQEMGA